MNNYQVGGNHRGYRPKKTVLREASLKENLDQKWVCSSYQRHYSDQYGFIIHYGKGFGLEYRGDKIVTVNSIEAAKMISKIILNDMLLK